MQYHHVTTCVLFTSLVVLSARGGRVDRASITPPDALFASSSLRDSIRVTPKTGALANARMGAKNAVIFRVANDGLSSVAATFTCVTTGVASNCRIDQDTMTLAAGASVRVPVRYTVSESGAGTVDLAVAGGAPMDRGHFDILLPASDSAVLPLRERMRVDAGGPMADSRMSDDARARDEIYFLINPAGGTFSAPVDVEIEYCAYGLLNPGSRTVTLNGSDKTAEFSYYSVPPECGDVAMSYGTVTLVPGMDNIFTTSICTKFLCGADTLVFNTPTADRPVVTVDANPQTLLDRGRCLASGAGPSGLFQCGSLLVHHEMPVFRSRDRDRALTLLYNSATAGPPTTVLADVRIVAGVTVPDSIVAVLVVDAVERGRWRYGTAGMYAGAPPRRIALPLDTSSLATGAYAYSVTLNSYSPSYAGGMLPDTAIGTLVVVNRRESPYGSGWSVAGTDQLFTTNVPANTRLVVSADGSYALYEAVAGSATRWIAPPGAYRDVLVQGERTMPAGTTGGYWRLLLDGTTIFYNASGRHIWTIDQAGDTVEYQYRNASSARAGISSIRVAPRASALTYTFNYTGSGTESELLDSIADPSARSMVALMSGTRLAALVDPTAAQNPSYAGFPGGVPTQSVTDSVRFGYASDGTLTSWISRRDATTTYTYKPGTSLLSGTSMPLGVAWSYEPVSARGLATARTGNTGVDSASVTTTIDEPSAAAYTFWTNRFGAPVRIDDPDGNSTTITYASASPMLPAVVRTPNRQVTWATYDSIGNVTAAGDSTYPTGVDSTTYEYSSPNARGLPTKIKSPIEVGGARDSVVISYTALGLPDTIRDPRGNTARFYYTAGRLSSIAEPLGTTAFTYAGTLGNMETVTVPSVLYAPGFTTTYHYDAAGRVRQMELPGRIGSSYFYPGVMNRMEAVAVYDTVGQWNANQSTYPRVFKALVTQYDYDRDGNDTLRLDPRGARRTRSLDVIGRVINARDEFGRVDAYGYDGGRVSSIARRNNTVTNFFYDAFGRDTLRVFVGGGMSGDSVRTSYDVMSNATSVDNTTGTVTRRYTTQGHVSRETQLNKSLNASKVFNYTYVPAGLRRTMSTPNGGSVSYKYGPGLLLDSMTWAPLSGDTRSATYTYDSMLRRRTTAFAGGVTATFRYDVNGTILRAQWGLDSLGFRATALTAAGELKEYDNVTTDGSPHVLLAYDNRGQLIQDATGTYLYDESGNRVIAKSGADSTVTFLVRAGLVSGTGSDRLERAVSYTGLNTRTHWYRYDLSGWLVMDSLNTGTQNLRYDNIYYASGMLRTHDYAGGVTQYRYDGLGRLINRRTSNALGEPVYYDGVNTAVDGSLDIIHEPGVDVPIFTATCYVIAAGGRLFGGVGTDGAPCGPSAQSGAIENSMGFTQQRQPDDAPPAQFTPLSFFRNRWYDGNTGRFTQEDPIGFAGGSNLYAYAGNNPASFTDPFGLCPPEDSNFGPGCPGFFTAASAAFGAAAGAFTGGSAGGVGGGMLCAAGGPLAIACGGAGAMAGAASGAAYGAATGAFVGSMVDNVVMFAKKRDIHQVDQAARKALGRRPTDAERGDFGKYLHQEKGPGPDFPKFKDIVKLAKDFFGVNQ